MNRNFFRLCTVMAAMVSIVLLDGCASMGMNSDPRDPFEGFNRTSYNFNQGMDKAVFHPISRFYQAITPDFVDQGVSNFFSNINDVVVIVNDILQFKLNQAISDLSRLVVNSIAILLTSVIAPGVILYFSLGLFSSLGWLSPLGFAGALLVVALHTFYWIALVLMMGTLSESSSVVIAVPMALYFAFWMGSGLIPGLVYISPLLLTFSPEPDNIPSVAASLMSGEPVFSWLPVISTTAFCVIFIAVAIRRFNRQEF